MKLLLYWNGITSFLHLQDLRLKNRMDCEEKDALLIFLLVLTGLETALLAAILFLFCRRKVGVP